MDHQWKIGDKFVVTTGWCEDQFGVITGFLVKPVDGCTVWGQLKGWPNPIGWRESEIRYVGPKPICVRRPR